MLTREEESLASHSSNSSRVKSVAISPLSNSFRMFSTAGIVGAAPLENDPSDPLPPLLDPPPALPPVHGGMYAFLIFSCCLLPPAIIALPCLPLISGLGKKGISETRTNATALTADFPELRLLGLGPPSLPPRGPLEVAEQRAAHAHVEEETRQDDGRAAPTAVLLDQALRQGREDEGTDACKRRFTVILPEKKIKYGRLREFYANIKGEGVKISCKFCRRRMCILLNEFIPDPQTEMPVAKERRRSK